MNRWLLALVGAAGVVALAGTASAGGNWSDSVSYKPARETSLKITEPQGFAVHIAGPDGEKSSTVPEIFNLSDQDAYVNVTLTSTSGDTWTTKVEVKPHRQTELVVTYAPTQTFNGKLSNLGYACGMSYNAAVRFDFVRGDGTIAKSQQVATRAAVNVAVDGGTYDVKTYVAAGGAWSPSTTSRWNITKNGWSLGFGCKAVGDNAPLILSVP